MIFNPRIQKSSGPAGTQISTLEVGTLVKINENGAPVEFYLAKHNYEEGLNGAGRELFVRKDCYDERSWDEDNVNAWASSSMRAWLNGGYKNLFSSGVQALMGATTYYYTPGNGNNTVTTRSDAVFLLSLTELGRSHSYANTEGSALPIASTLRIAYRNGSATTQWTRSPLTSLTYIAWALGSSGGIYDYGCGFSHGSRPAFTLPATALVDTDLNLIEEVA